MKLRTSLSFVAAFAALAAVPANGQDTAKPVPCAGFLVTDPSGDAASYAGTVPAADNTDIKGVFFRNDPDGVLSANIQIANLDKSVPATSQGLDYYVFFQVGEATKFVRANNTGGTITFDHGTDDPAQGLTSDGATGGAFFEGPDGIIKLEIPEAVLPADGGPLKNVVARTGDNQLAVIFYVDVAPDDAETAALSTPVKPCGVADPPARPAGPAAPARLDLKVKASRTGSKDVKLGLTTAGTLSNLQFSLAKGSKVIAKAKLAKLDKKGSVTLKPKSKPKAGTYKLAVKTAQGSATYTVKLKG